MEILVGAGLSGLDTKSLSLARAKKIGLVPPLVQTTASQHFATQPTWVAAGGREWPSLVWKSNRTTDGVLCSAAGRRTRPGPAASAEWLLPKLPDCQIVASWATCRFRNVETSAWPGTLFETHLITLGPTIFKLYGWVFCDPYWACCVIKAHLS